MVTRGHNIVTDGLAGASNPHSLPYPPETGQNWAKIGSKWTNTVFFGTKIVVQLGSFGFFAGSLLAARYTAIQSGTIGQEQ